MDASLLLQKHSDLDFLCRHPGDRIFVSDWYCRHPFSLEYLPTDATVLKQSEDLLNYCFQNDTHEIHDEIRTFHLNNDGVLYTNDNIYIGAGTTGLLTAQMLMLVELGIKRLWYLRPLYYTFYYLARIFNIELIPVCDAPLNRSGIELRLPHENCWLLVCDPIWFMGRSIEAEYIEQIRQWQRRTESKVIVDGAFQYMKWNVNDRYESTSKLNRDLTFRTICPTKSLALHGVRFAYTLLPERYRENMRYAYANSFGSSCVFSHYAAKRIMEVLNSPESNSKLLSYIQHRYKEFLGRNIFTDYLEARATYFVFVVMNGDLSKYIAMDQVFFDTANYPGHVRFNLLLPHDI